MTRNDSLGLLIVLGMHRSGTSLITNILSNAGYYIGEDDDVMQGDTNNLQGYFERWSVMRLNDTILENCGGDWKTPPDEDCVESASADEDIKTLLADYSGHERYALKDPRMCITLPVWQKVIGHDVPLLVITRNTDAVAASLEMRDGLPYETSAKLQSIYNKRIDKYAQSHPTFRLTYEDLCSDNQSTVINELGAFLGISNALVESASNTVDTLIPLLRKAKSFSAQGRTPEAVTQLEELLKLRPDHHEALTELALLYKDSGLREEAIAAYLKLRQLAPDDVDILWALVALNQETGQKAEAAKYVKLIQAIEPDNIELLSYLAQEYSDAGHSEEACATLEQLLSLDPENYEAMRKLGAIYRRLNRKLEAIEIYQTILEVSPREEGVISALSSLHLELGNAEQSAQFAARLAALDISG